MSTQASGSTLDPYRELPPIKGLRLKLTSTSPFTAEYVQSALTQSADPVGIYQSRIKGRQIMLENPVRESKAKKARDEKRAKAAADKAKKKAGVIGRREANDKGVWTLEREQTRFALFVPIHRLWLGYMSELLALPMPGTRPVDRAMPAAAGMHAKLVKADFHGSFITVRQSKNPCLVGLSGIVIHETENAFKVITKHNTLKLLPKQNSIFVLAVPLYAYAYSVAPLPNAPPPPTPPAPNAPREPHRTETAMETVTDIPHIEFDLFGNQFRFRSADRAGRKFKPKETIEL
ncbi:RNase P/MRP p29 subunit [Athelia psychrophila]|uniref:RNase P/MRP p29 subunit n=1 Tax=Athelia psychrophila TaxID=1759441 RepID=A0A165ZE39_9AGAM|nr:RNase P/MRP p29 subunit [Fibularhizoctonia sp. CBS 109695]